MRILFFIFTIVIFNYSFAQRNISPYVGIYHSSSINENFRTNYFLEGNVEAGINIPLKKGSISISGSYLLGSLMSQKSKDFRYHALGGMIEYNLRDFTKKHRFSIRINALTEIHSSYKGRYLLGRSKDNKYVGYKFYVYPRATFQKEYSLTGSHGSTKYLYNYAHYYISTPLFLSITPSYKYQIIGGLFLDIGIAYSIPFKKNNS